MEPGNRKILVYQPAYVWLVSVTAIIVLVSAGYLLFQHGVRYSGTEVVNLGRALEEMTVELKDARRRNADLQQQLAVTERSSEIDRHANIELRNQFAGLQDEVLELRKELEFYRGIVSPKDDRAGLDIQRFELRAGSESGHYLFSVMLTQMRRNERYVRGVMEIDIEGIQDGVVKVLPLSAVIQGERKPLKFKFRYFQNFEGEIRIPDEFEPQSVKIRLEPSGKGQPQGVEKTMDWPA